MTPLHHHRLIRTLLADLRTLRQDYAELQESQEDSQAQISRAAYRLAVAHGEISHAADLARQEESDRYWRELDRANILHDLEIACANHNPYGSARALAKLKKL